VKASKKEKEHAKERTELAAVTCDIAAFRTNLVRARALRNFSEAALGLRCHRAFC